MSKGNEMTPHSAAYAKDLASRIVRDNPDNAVVLIELLGGLIDPDGEALRYSAGEETMRYLYTLTPQFEDAFSAYVKSPQLALEHLEASS